MGRKSKKIYGKDCLCGNGELCQGLAAAFHLMQDPRRGYAKLPRFFEDPQTPEQMEINQQRAAYLRYLRPNENNKNDGADLFNLPTTDIALHHFHPTVVLRAASNSTTRRRPRDLIPKTITEEEMEFLELDLTEQDRVIDEDGFFTGEFFFVPNYPIKKAKKDVKRLARATRISAEFAPPATGESTKDSSSSSSSKQEAASSSSSSKAISAKQQQLQKPKQLSLALDPTTSRMKPPPEASVRSNDLRRLRAWERERREDYRVVLERSCLQWRAAVQLAEEGIVETARAERLILGTAMANQVYAAALQDMYHDVLVEDDGRPVTDGRRKSQLLEERKWLDNAVDIAPNLTADHLIEAENKKTMLTYLIRTQSKLADKFMSCGKYGTEEVGRDVTVFREDLTREVRGMETMGESLIHEMEEAEREVQLAWQAFDAMAGPEEEQEDVADPPLDEGIILAKESPIKRKPSSRPSPGASIDSLLAEPDWLNDQVTNTKLSDRITKSLSEDSMDELSPKSESSSPMKFFQIMAAKKVVESPASPTSPAASTGGTASPHKTTPSAVALALRKVGRVRDVWVLEQLYRSAAKHEAKVWEICLRLLSQMHAAVKEMELEREIKVHSMMLDFLPRERRMFRSLPATSHSVLDNLVSLRQSRDVMEQTIEDSVTIRSRLLLKSDHHRRSSILNRSRIKAAKDGSGDQLSGEPFHNSLFRHAKVVKRNVGMLSSVWKTSLAVLTADHYLHFFDLYDLPDIEVGSCSEEAYGKLLPKYDFPSIDDPYKEPRQERLLQRLTPADSLNLLKCDVKSALERREIEITENRTGRFTESAKRRMLLETRSQQETDDFLDLLQNRPSEDVPEEEEGTFW